MEIVALHDAGSGRVSRIAGSRVLAMVRLG